MCDRDGAAAGESRETAESSSQGEKCVRKRKWLAGSGPVHGPCGMWSSKCPLDLATRKSEGAVRGQPRGSGGAKARLREVGGEEVGKACADTPG